MAPVWEALTDIMGADQLRRRRDKGEIEVAPVAFMRGRTLAHAYVIVDEAQNASRLQMKMVLTRLGEGARMAVTGDPSQVDLLELGGLGPGPRACSILEGVEGVAWRASPPRTSCATRWSNASCAPTTTTPRSGFPRARPARAHLVETDDRGRGRGAAWRAALPDAEQIAPPRGRGGARRSNRAQGPMSWSCSPATTRWRELNARFRGKTRPDQCAVVPRPAGRQPAPGRHRPGFRRLRARGGRAGQALAHHLHASCGAWRAASSRVRPRARR